MKVEMTDHFVQSFLGLPQPIQKAFGKQLGFLLKDIRHPSLTGVEQFVETTTAR